MSNSSDFDKNCQQESVLLAVTSYNTQCNHRKPQSQLHLGTSLLVRINLLIQQALPQALKP